MRVVLYDDETMEPITVLHLSSWMVPRLKAGERIRVLLPPRRVESEDSDGPISAIPTLGSYTVSIWFEPFVRHGRKHWFAFTRDSENALQLKSVFLPGQWPALHEEYQRGIGEGILRAIDAFLR
jgi:hypothetical protein